MRYEKNYIHKDNAYEIIKAFAKEYRDTMTVAKSKYPYHEWQRDGPDEATATGLHQGGQGANSHSAAHAPYAGSADR